MLKWLVKNAGFLILCVFLGMKRCSALLIGVAAVAWMLVCLIRWEWED